MRIVLLNGPPRSGKDTVAKALTAEGYAHLSLARILKERAHALFGLKVPFDFFEDRKDEPAPEFGGMTPRRVYIDVSEKIVKPAMGKDIWARWLREQIDELIADGVKVREFLPEVGFAISDLGFPYEVPPLVAGLDPLIVQVHRPGTSFKNDSREYVTYAGVPTLELNNIRMSLPEFYRTAVTSIASYFSEIRA